MESAANKFNALKQSGCWQQPASEQDKKIIMLQAKIKLLEQIPHHLLWSDLDPVSIGAGRGKDRPVELGPLVPYKNLGRKTVGLLLCLMQPIHTSGCCVILAAC